MKIVFLIQDCTTIGGTERTTCCLANAMARHGHDVTLISVFRTGGECKFPLDGNVRFVVLSDFDYTLKVSALKRMMVLLGEVRNLRKNRAVRECDVIVAQKFFAAMLAVRAGFGAKTFVGDHYAYDLYHGVMNKVRDAVYRKAKAVVVLTEGNAVLYRQNGVSRVEVIPNMLPIKISEHVGGQQEIIAVGRLTYQKGFDTLLYIIDNIKERIAGWHLTIYGEGEDRKMLERIIDERQLVQFVTLYGATDNIEKAYREAEFGVMTSRFEGFPMVLLEAVAAGLPMVSFDCPTGPKDIYKDGAGIVVPDQDIKAIGEAIVRMTQDGQLRDKLSRECATVRETYSEENIYRQWMKVIDNYIQYGR